MSSSGARRGFVCTPDCTTLGDFWQLGRTSEDSDISQSWPECQHKSNEVNVLGLVRTSEDKQPVQESNLFPQFRKPLCHASHPRAEQSRRLDSHQHDPTYEAGTFSLEPHRLIRGPGGN